MKKWIIQWLGLTEIDQQIDFIRTDLYKISQLQITTLNQIRTITPGMARIITKLDPQFARNELDPERKAESDKLGDEVIAKLIAEDKARRHTFGES